jgi:hypothetical protein
MSTKISTIYDAIIAKMAVIFPNKKRFPFGKEVDRNDSNFLKDSWGIWVVDHSLEELEFCNYSLSYGINLTLAREVIFTDHDYSRIDEQVKLMLEDISLITKTMSNPDQIGVDDSIESIAIQSASGIDEVFTDNSRFIYSTISLRIIVSETI